MHITNVSGFYPFEASCHSLIDVMPVDLGMMREPRYRFTGEHAKKYLESMRPSQPEADFDDRNAIYAM